MKPAASNISVLLVDLNNFSSYPTLAIGQLIARLRSDGINVELLSPMQHGVAGSFREKSDILDTVAFLNRNHEYFDRIKMSRFKAIPGTRFDLLFEKNPKRFPGVEEFEWDYEGGRAFFSYKPSKTKPYRNAKRKLLDKCFEINSKNFAVEPKNLTA